MKVRAKAAFDAEQFDNNRFIRDRTLPAGCERRLGVDEEGAEYEKRPVLITAAGEVPLDHGDWIVTDAMGHRTKYAEGRFQEVFAPLGDSSCWLIEYLNERGEPGGRRYVGSGKDVTDACLARRFARKEEADRWLRSMNIENAAAVEHAV